MYKSINNIGKFVWKAPNTHSNEWERGEGKKTTQNKRTFKTQQSR